MSNVRRQSAPIEPQAFVAYLLAEIERATRHERAFALFIFHSPLGPEAARSFHLREAAQKAANLVRGCDFVVLFEAHHLFGVLLPETEFDGARVVLQRLHEGVEELSQGWRLETAMFPQDSAKIDAFVNWWDAQRRLIESQGDDLSSLIA